MTVQDFIVQAFADATVTAVGELPETLELQRAFVWLNQIVSSRSLERDFVYTASHSTFSISNTVSAYTVGASGSWNTAARPVRITGAKASSGNFEQGLSIMSMEKFTQAISNGNGVTSALPKLMGVDTGAPNLSVRIWPTPNANASIEIHYWLPLTQFAALTDIINFPVPGYEPALRTELAVEICTGYGRPVPVELAGNMNRYSQRILATNAAVEEPAAVAPQAAQQGQ